MIELEIPARLRALARRRAGKLGKLRNSITRGEGNVAGYLGELLVLTAYGDEAVREDTRHWDLVMNGRRVDVKTKRQASDKPPPLHYSASIANFNATQKCDEYWFVRVNNEYTRGWILGWLTPEEYKARATFHTAGEWDRSNGFRFRADCYNVPYSDLNPPPQPKGLT